MSFSSIAQNSKKIEILNADSTFANANIHPDYWRLIGNVSFKHNGAIMTCDSAYHYISENKMKAFGDIFINKGDSITIKAKKLLYTGIDNIALLSGGVILKDKYNTLTTEIIKFNLEKDIAYYDQKGKIEDDKQTIISDKGEYFTKLEKYYFKDSVKVIAKDYHILTNHMNYDTKVKVNYFKGPSYFYSGRNTIYCENGWYHSEKGLAEFLQNAYIVHNDYLLKADTLFYEKAKRYAIAHSNVILIDTVENMRILGGVAEYFENEEKTIIKKKPVLELVQEDDTLFMHAKQFISVQKENEEKILAYNKVTFYKTDFQGKCDSLTYNFTDSVVEMYKQPILWSNEFQITADSLQFFIYNGKINNMYLHPNPMIIAKEDSLDYNQIKGKEITTYFRNNKINRMDVKGNGQSVFIVTDEKTNDKIGLNYTECTDLILYFKNNKLDAVNYKVKPNSTTTPYQDIEEKNRYLKGFNWRGNEQPKSKEDIFN